MCTEANCVQVFMLQRWNGRPHHPNHTSNVTSSLDSPIYRRSSLARACLPFWSGLSRFHDCLTMWKINAWRCGTSPVDGPNVKPAAADCRTTDFPCMCCIMLTEIHTHRVVGVHRWKVIRSDAFTDTPAGDVAAVTVAVTRRVIRTFSQPLDFLKCAIHLEASLFAVVVDKSVCRVSRTKQIFPT